MQWMVPFHAVSAANWIGVYAQRYMHDYGLTREQLAQIPLNQRRHAALYDEAIFRDPLTMDDYLNARMVSYPLGLFDCDIPCDGSCAVIVSRADAAPDLKHVVRIEAIGSALTGRNTWDQRDDLTETAAHDCVPMMWARTDLTIDDVDTVQLYDGFSFLTITWLEALGLFPKGEAGPWLEAGERRIGLGGQIPLNTNGGQLSGGRLHGYGYLYEACAELRGDADRSPGRGGRGRRGRRRWRAARGLHVADEGPLIWPPPRPSPPEPCGPRASRRSGTGTSGCTRWGSSRRSVAPGCRTSRSRGWCSSSPTAGGPSGW